MKNDDATTTTVTYYDTAIAVLDASGAMPATMRQVASRKVLRIGISAFQVLVKYLCSARHAGLPNGWLFQRRRDDENVGEIKTY